MEKDLYGLFTTTKDNIAQYIELRLRLQKVEAYEKLGRVSAVLLIVLLVLFIVFFAVLFLFLGLGYYLGHALGSQSLGMVLIGCLYLLFLAGVWLFRNKIMNKVLGLFVSELMKDDDGDKKE